MSVSLLSVSGPIMIGPSSSHTAGALKIGKLAHELFGKPVKKVRIYLHGSFADVYEGHATDKAIIGGLLGFKTDDTRIKDAFELAKKENMDYEFIPTDLGKKHHPNTARIEIIDTTDINNTPLIITGASIGGGAIRLTGINQFPLNFREPVGNTSTLIIVHNDKQGILNMITSMLITEENNIASLHSERNEKDGDALTIIVTDNFIDSHILQTLRNLENINSVFILK